MGLVRVALLLLSVALLVALALWVRRALVVYRIERDEMTWRSPVEALPAGRDGIDGLREVQWTLRDGSRQRAFHAPGTNGVVVVIAHGSPGTALSMLPEARGLARRGYGVLLLNLPGYGGSEGPRTWGANFREAVRAAVDFAAAQPGVRRVAGYGYSMSTCIMMQVAADDPRIAALVLLAPFTDIAAQRAYQHRSRLPGVAEIAIPTARHFGLATDELDATAAVRRLGGRPLLLIVGDQDAAIPLWMPDRLKGLAEKADLWVVAGAGHADIAASGGDALIERIDAFLQSHSKPDTDIP